MIIMSGMKKIFFAVSLFLFAVSSFAAVTGWSIAPATSSIKFTATQNNAPVSGEFKNFTGTINFDPADLAGSNIEIDVDLASVMTSYKEVMDTLKTSDWFDVKDFPKAVFKASSFTKTGDKAYVAKGNLNIRGISVPVDLAFVLDTFTASKAHATGSVMVKRLLFDLGKGSFSGTDDIKDDVKVDFVLDANKK
jgi:polyisoprenoid-binding protein YceI